MRAICLTVAVIGLLAGCNGDAELQAERAQERRAVENEMSDESIFDLFRNQSQPDRQVAVNRYLWQASLDVLSFLPVEGADPFSGLLVTGWGRVASDGGVYRVTVYISDPGARRLGAQGRGVPPGRRAGGAGRRRGEQRARGRDPDPGAAAPHRRGRRAAVVREARCRATTPAASSRSGRRPGRPPACSAPSATPPGRSSTCWRCFPIRRGASIWGTCATTRWATSSPATSRRGASTCCTRWAGTPSACRPRTPPSRRACRRRSGPTRTSTRCGRR